MKLGDKFVLVETTGYAQQFVGRVYQIVRRDGGLALQRPKAVSYFNSAVPVLNPESITDDEFKDMTDESIFKPYVREVKNAVGR